MVISNFRKPVSIVMIVYTEENHIYELISSYYDKILNNLDPRSEFIIYLDSPPDDSSRIVKNLSKEINLVVIEGKTNLGYAGALKKALSVAKHNIIFYSDSSGKHQADDFWKLIPFENKYDIVSGFRNPRQDPIIRRIISFGQRLLIACLFNVPMYDFNSGYKIIHRNIFNFIVSDCKYMNQNFSTELILRSYYKKFSIKEVNVLFKNRIGVNSGTNIKQLFKIIKLSLVGFMQLRNELKKG